MSSNEDKSREYIKAKLATARAAKGWKWAEVAKLMVDLGIETSESTLTTQFSRGTMRANEFVVLLRSMGVRFLDLSELDIDGMTKALMDLEARKKAKPAKGKEQ